MNRWKTEIANREKTRRCESTYIVLPKENRLLYDPHAEDIIHRADAVRDVLADARAEVDDRIRILVARLIYHVLDVYVPVADEIKDSR